MFFVLSENVILYFTVFLKPSELPGPTLVIKFYYFMLLTLFSVFLKKKENIFIVLYLLFFMYKPGLEYALL